MNIVLSNALMSFFVPMGTPVSRINDDHVMIYQLPREVTRTD